MCTYYLNYMCQCQGILSDRVIILSYIVILVDVFIILILWSILNRYYQHIAGEKNIHHIELCGESYRNSRHLSANSCEVLNTHRLIGEFFVQDVALKIIAFSSVTKFSVTNHDV